MMQLYMDSNKSYRLHDNKLNFLLDLQQSYTFILHEFQSGSAVVNLWGYESTSKRFGKSL